MIKNTSPISTESNAILSKDYYHGNRIGMSILAASLLIAAGLSTGLILAICGLDYSWLEMKSVTGSPKERFVQPKILFHAKNNNFLENTYTLSLT